MDRGGGAQPGARGRQPPGQVILDRLHALLDLAGAGGSVAELLAAVVNPHDAVSLRGGPRRLAGGPDLVRLAGPAGCAVSFGPVRLVVLHPGAERGVFLAAARQHGDEPAAAPVDVAHRLRRGELAVRDVQEAGAAGQLDQRVPGGDVGRVVIGVAVREPVDDRHGVIPGHGQDEHQLLQVRPVILGVPPRDRRRRGAGHVLAAGVLVGAVHADGGGVVVQPRAVDGELADHARHQLGEQAAPVSMEQPVQHPAGPVVVEQFRLPRGQPQQGRLVGGGPLAQGVQRPVLYRQVRDHHRDHHRGVQRQPGIISRDPGIQQPEQAHPGREAADQRQGAETLGGQRERRRVHRHLLDGSPVSAVSIYTYGRRAPAGTPHDTGEHP